MEQMEPVQENPQETPQVVTGTPIEQLPEGEYETMEMTLQTGVSTEAYIEGVADFIRPPYHFLGQDGLFYKIGDTPRNCEEEMFVVMDRIGTLGSSDPTMREFIDLWDDWIYDHVRVVDGQRHLTRDDIRGLYFVVDRPEIISMIFERFSQALTATTATLQVMTEAGRAMTDLLRMKKEALHGHSQQSGEQAVLQETSNT